MLNVLEKTKKCSKCSEIKNVDDFFNANRNFDGKDSYCKTCRKEYSKKYTKTNHERIKAQNRERRREKMKDRKRMFGDYARTGHVKINEELPNFKDIPTRYMLDELKKQSGYIYLIKEKSFTNQIKVGKSIKPIERMQRITGQIPFDLELEMIHCFYTDDVNRKERILHMFFSDKRKKGEWFELSETDISLIVDYMNNKIKLGWYS